MSENNNTVAYIKNRVDTSNKAISDTAKESMQKIDEAIGIAEELRKMIKREMDADKSSELEKS